MLVVFLLDLHYPLTHPICWFLGPLNRFGGQLQVSALQERLKEVTEDHQFTAAKVEGLCWEIQVQNWYVTLQ